MSRPETTRDLDLRIDDESTIPPTEMNPMPENVKAELAELKKRAKMSNGAYDESVVQEMIAAALPLEDDLDTIRRIQRNGGYKEQLAATQESLKLKRLLKPDAAVIVQQANLQAGPEELRAMFGVEEEGAIEAKTEEADA